MYTKDPRSETLPVDNRASPTANANRSRLRSVKVTLCCLLYMIVVGRLLSTGLNACFKRYSHTFFDFSERDLEVSGRGHYLKGMIYLSRMMSRIQRLARYLGLIAMSLYQAWSAEQLCRSLLSACIHPAFSLHYIRVPLNYFNHSEGTATIFLGRRKATKLPKQGSIMLNPGDW
jgi:hypothetical protein